LHQPFLGKLVDQQNHSTRQNAEKFCQALLIRPRHPGDEAQDASMGRGYSEMSDSFRETFGRKSAELSEKKREN
jgi:hypothetical protein